VALGVRCAIIRAVTLPASVARVLAVVVGAILLTTSAAVASSDSQAQSGSTASLLRDLGFTLATEIPDKNSVTFTNHGLIVPTPWGDFEATIVSTPVDRMLRVPLSPNTEPGQLRLQPYFTAGARKNVDSDTVLEQARPAAFGDAGRTNFKAGAGVLLRLDDNIELFGEYQFMRLHRDVESRGTLGPLGTSVDTSGFSLGISVRY